MEAPKTFFLTTQGCKVNQYESQTIREAWVKKGLRETTDAGSADTILINSCAVTQRAVQDLFRTIRRLHQQSNAKIIITGCAAQILSDELKQEPGVTRVVPQSAKTDLLDLPKKQSSPRITGYYRSRAAIKIQDGCSHNCSYCIIPKTRGRSVSRDFTAITDEIRGLFGAGISEVSLCGVNLRLFGRDLRPACDFWDLLAHLEDRLAEYAPEHRLRLSSLEPSELDDKALNTLKAGRLVCPHLHVSLQSASSTVLQGMKRGHYSAQNLLPFFEQISAFWPVFALGADIIVGFPGESEQEFEETYNFCSNAPLTYAHIFPFSPRPGTAATRFPNQIFPHIRHARAKTLRKLIAEKKQAFLTRLTSQKHLAIIPENRQKGMCQFYVECVSQAPLLPGKIQSVRPVSIKNNRLMVTI